MRNEQVAVLFARSRAV
jgi:hypothetical protein